MANRYLRNIKIGEYEVQLPSHPPVEQIANYNLPKKDQKFYTTKLPDGIEEWDRQGRPECEDKLSYESFEAQEWERRRNGYFFFNNGNIEYITGQHYVFLNYWTIENGKPEFIDAQRDVFYLWKFKVEDNPLSRGLTFITNRRAGKTHIANVLCYETISRTPKAHGGIQSKSNEDAGSVFEKLIAGWKGMVYFFKPMDIGISQPKSVLEFKEPSIRNTKSLKKKYGLVLDSKIDFLNSKEVAYDGKRQAFNIQDEIGKDPENNTYKRLQVVKECVVDGSTIIGKVFATSTIEEMLNEGGENCKKIWDACDPEDLMPNGETQIGLLRYFKPTYYGYRGNDEKGVPFIDEYGYSDVERTKSYFERKRKAIRDSDALTSERRKYPFDIHDCFLYDGEKTVYDSTRIEEQIRFNDSLPSNGLVRGNFNWKGGDKTCGIVEWMPNGSGKWLVAWMPPYELWNKKVIKYGQQCPGNIHLGCFGLDPYDNKVTVDDRKSNAASYGINEFDPMKSYDTGILITEYINRPPLPEIMFEDMIMQSVFYGWEVLIESNKIGTINHFRERGFYEYVMGRPPETQAVIPGYDKVVEKGIPLSGEEARMALIYAIQNYIGHKVGMIQEEGKEPYMGKLYFNNLLTCWKKFTFDKRWTAFDEMVASGLAILGSRKKRPMVMNQKPLEPLFPTFRNGQRVDPNQNERQRNQQNGWIVKDM